jgi:hypothetical protein
MGRLVGTVLLLGAAYLIVSSLPDIARYMKIREM